MAQENNDNDSVSMEMEASPVQTQGLPGWLLPTLLVLGVAIAIGGKFVVKSCDRIYYPPDHGQMGDPPEYLVAVRDAMMANSAIGYGIFGAVLVGLLGATTGAASSTASLVIGALAGALLGGGLSAAGAACGTFIEHNTFQIDMDGMIKSAMIVGWMFVAISWASSITIFLADRSAGFAKALKYGIVFSVLGILLYIFIATAIFPVSRPESLQPESVSIRYLAMTCLGVIGALACFLTAKPSRPRSSA